MKKYLVILVALMLLFAMPSSIAAPVLDAYAGSWNATSIGYDGVSLDAKAVGFDMKVDIVGTKVTLNSDAMGLSNQTFEFMFTSSLIYSENNGNENILINIDMVDENTLNMYETVNGETLVIALARLKEDNAPRETEIKELPKGAEGVIVSGTTDIIVPEWKIVKTKYSGYNLIMAFTNISDHNIPNAAIQVILRDESGAIAAVVEDGHDGFLPGTTVVTKKSIYEDELKYSTVEVLIDTEKYTNNYKNHVEKLDIQSNVSKDNVYVEITNNADCTIEEIEVVVVFYRNGEIAGADSDEVYDLKSADKCAMELKGYQTYQADEYRIYVNQAHTFGIW